MKTVSLCFGILTLFTLSDVVMTTSFTTCGRDAEGYGQMAQDVAKCATSDMMKKITQAAQDGNLKEILDTVLKPMCRHVECGLECANNVVGGCTNYPWYLIYNMDNMKINFRVMCNLLKTREDVLHSCLPQAIEIATSCAQPVVNDMIEASSAMMIGDSGEYTSDMCEFFNSLRACMILKPTETCSAESAELLTQMYRAMYSYSQCGHTLNIKMDSYLGEIRCDKALDTNKYCYVYKCDPSIETCLTLENAILTGKTRMCPMGIHGCYTKTVSNRHVEAGCSSEYCYRSSENTCCDYDRCNHRNLDTQRSNQIALPTVKVPSKKPIDDTPHRYGKPVVSMNVCDYRGRTYAAGHRFTSGCESCVCQDTGYVSCMRNEHCRNGGATISSGRNLVLTFVVVMVGYVIRM